MAHNACSCSYYVCNCLLQIKSSYLLFPYYIAGAVRLTNCAFWGPSNQVRVDAVYAFNVVYQERLYLEYDVDLPLNGLLFGQHHWPDKCRQLVTPEDKTHLFAV